MSFTISKQDILNIAFGTQGSAHKKLRELFPSVFNGQKKFCRLGTVIRRNDVPSKSILAVIKWRGEVRIMNLTYGEMWEGRIPLNKLTDPNGNHITRDEFNELCTNKSDKVERFDKIVEL